MPATGGVVARSGASGCRPSRVADWDGHRTSKLPLRAARCRDRGGQAGCDPHAASAAAARRPHGRARRRQGRSRDGACGRAPHERPDRGAGRDPLRPRRAVRQGRGGRGGASGAGRRGPRRGAPDPRVCPERGRGRPGALPDLGRRLGSAGAAGGRPRARGQAGGQPRAARLGCRHRPDERGAQAPLGDQGRAPRPRPRIRRRW